MYHLSEAYLMATFICLLCGYLGAVILAVTSLPRMAGRYSGDKADDGLIDLYWRSVHRFAVIGGLIFTTTSALASGKTALPSAYALMLVSLAGLMSVGFFVSMQTLPNAARPLESRRQDTLSLSNWILITSAILTGLVLIAALVYVLPGQFTFWPTAQ